MTGVTYQLTRAGFSTLFGVTSLYLAAAARRMFVGQRDWIKRGITAEGRILDVEVFVPSGDTVRRKFYRPIVAFRSGPGEDRQFTSSMSSSDSNRYVVGQRVTVRYLPDDPAVVDLDRLTGVWWPFLTLVLATLVCAVIAALPFVLGPPNGR